VGTFDEFANSASANVQDVLDDLDAAIDVAGAQPLFRTIDAPNGTDPVADTSTDTLQLIDGNSIAMTGSAAGDSVTVGVSNDGIDGAQLADNITLDADLGFTGGFDVGIGTNAPDSLLHLEGTAPQLYIKSQDGTDYSATLRLSGETGDNWRGGYLQYDAAGNALIIGVHDANDKSTASDIESLILDRTTGSTTLTGDVNAAGGYRNTAGTWNRIDVPANQTAVALNLLGSTTNSEIVMPFAGSVVGISVASNAPRTNGTLTVEARINGAATGLTAVLDGTNTQYHSAVQAKDADTFAAGARLNVTFTTTAPWAPTTADVVVTLIVEF
jgi:hypothetical protein